MPFTWQGPCGPIEFLDLTHANSFVNQILSLPPSATFDCAGDPRTPISILKAQVLILQAHLLLPHEGPRGATGATGSTGGIGLTGLQGIPGLEPTSASLLDLINSALQALGSLIGPRGDSGIPGIPGLPGIQGIQGIEGIQGDVGPGGGGVIFPPAPARVKAGGTLQAPVIIGSADDPDGLLRPIFPRTPVPASAPPPGPAPTGFEATAALGIQALKLWLAERQRRFQERQARRARDIWLAQVRIQQVNQQTLFGLLDRRNTSMSFGQSLESIARTIGNVAESLAPVLPLFFPPQPAPVLQGFPSPPRLDPNFFPPLPSGGFTPVANRPPLSLPAPGGGAMTLGGGGAVGELFKVDALGRVRARNKATIMGPDGQCHFFLKAVPKGWKVNVANVSGRRGHHHHRRP